MYRVQDDSDQNRQSCESILAATTHVKKEKAFHSGEIFIGMSEGMMGDSMMSSTIKQRKQSGDIIDYEKEFIKESVDHRKPPPSIPQSSPRDQFERKESINLHESSNTGEVTPFNTSVDNRMRTIEHH